MEALYNLYSNDFLDLSRNAQYYLVITDGRVRFLFLFCRTYIFLYRVPSRSPAKYYISHSSDSQCLTWNQKRQVVPLLPQKVQLSNYHLAWLAWYTTSAATMISNSLSNGASYTGFSQFKALTTIGGWAVVPGKSVDKFV